MTDITTETQPGTSPEVTEPTGPANPPAPPAPPAPSNPTPEDPAVPATPQPPNDPPADPANPPSAIKRDTEKTEEEPSSEVATQAVTGEVLDAEPHKGEQTKTVEMIAPKKKVWIFGKPAEAGGEEDEWLQLIQRPLSVLNSMAFFGMMADTIVNALEKGATELDQILGRMGSGGGGIRLSLDSLDDPGQFFLIILRLMRVAPNFIVDSFIMWLEVKPGDEMWFRQIITQRHNPEEEEWGPTQEMIGELIEVFLEQNYEETRRFFTETLGKVVAKARHIEEQRKARVEARASISAPLKR